MADLPNDALHCIEGAWSAARWKAAGFSLEVASDLVRDPPTDLTIPD